MLGTVAPTLPDVLEYDPALQFEQAPAAVTLTLPVVNLFAF
jgi:hypothetical protein